MIERKQSIEGIKTIIEHYEKWLSSNYRPFIRFESGCVIIEEYCTYLLSKSPEKINEYDMKFDLIQRCKLIREEIIKAENIEKSRKTISLKAIVDIEEIISSITAEYYEYIKRCIIYHFIKDKKE